MSLFNVREGRLHPTNHLEYCDRDSLLSEWSNGLRELLNFFDAYELNAVLFDSL